MLTPHDLYTYVRKQVEEIFFSVLVMRAGAFYFYRTDEDHGPVSQLSLSTKQLLFDGVRRIDELSYFREKLPSADVVLQRRHPAPPTKLEAKEERVLQLVDGARDLGAIARAVAPRRVRDHQGALSADDVGLRRLQGAAGGQDVDVAPGDSLAGHLRQGGRRLQRGLRQDLQPPSRSAEKRSRCVKGLESFFGSVAEFAPLFVGLSMDERGMLPREQLLRQPEHGAHRRQARLPAPRPQRAALLRAVHRR